MSERTLDERVTALEQAVSKLLAGERPSQRKKDWRRTVGMFADDPVMKEIQEEGRKIREADRQSALSDSDEAE